MIFFTYTCNVSSTNDILIPPSPNLNLVHSIVQMAAVPPIWSLCNVIIGEILNLLSTNMDGDSADRTCDILIWS